MPSRQDSTLPRFRQRLCACRDYSEVLRLASQYSYEPLFVDKSCAEWCLSRGMTDRIADHALRPILQGLRYPNDYYDDVLDANAIGQCIFFLFQTSYTGIPFFDIRSLLGELNAWGKLFCLANCYLSRAIQLLQESPDRQIFEPYEARALLNMNYLGCRFDITFPLFMWTEMVAYDCLTTGKIYEVVGYPEDNEQWRRRAKEFIEDKEPTRLESESLESMAKMGEEVSFTFFKEREANFKQNKYCCTVEEVRALVTR